ncbi:MAG: hypothetical protein ACREPB_08665 [Arenimonas sp.]
MTDITREELESLVSFSAQEELVVGALKAAFSDPVGRVRFLGRYTSWNGFFGSGVATLAGKIGRCRRAFLDPNQPVHALADRSVYVASFFFDAARDEFDDRDTVHRDTHRCLAQSTLKGLIDFEMQKGVESLDSVSKINALLDEPDWLNALNMRVAKGYGSQSADDLPSIFHAIGYHLGSELLADREFSIIDETLRTSAAELTAYLQSTKVEIAGQSHVAYQWVGIHSGHGGGAEADHFDWATQGVKLALRFVPAEQHLALKANLHEGFRAFAKDHREFFERTNQN